MNSVSRPQRLAVIAPTSASEYTTIERPTPLPGRCRSMNVSWRRGSPPPGLSGEQTGCARTVRACARRVTATTAAAAPPQGAVADDDVKRVGVVSDELGTLADSSAEVTLPREPPPGAVAVLHDPAGHRDRASWVLECENTTHRAARFARLTASARCCENTTRHAGQWLNPAVTLRRLAALVAAGVVYIAVRVRRASIGSTRLGTPRRPPGWLALGPVPELHGSPPEQSQERGELFDFAVTCPHCGDRTRLIRWTRGRDDKPPGGVCSRCGWPDRHVDTGVPRGIRLPEQARLRGHVGLLDYPRAYPFRGR